jgi:murein DD-endopeptidase MepM/ murein hydrolase activator NlpD
MLWDCSELAIWRRPLAMALMIGLVAAPGPAGASGREAWLRATFPVQVFAGYTSGFGLRIHPVDGGMRPHYGLDIAAPLGSPVRNWWSGVLVEILQGGGCGNGLVIRSGDYEHTYCHLAGSVIGSKYQSGAVQLQVGQRLRTGQTIAHVGMTGSSTGPHLHWGIRYRGAWLDPARVLWAMAASRRFQAPRMGSPPKVGTFQ